MGVREVCRGSPVAVRIPPGAVVLEGVETRLPGLALEAGMREGGREAERTSPLLARDISFIAYGRKD